MSIIKYLAESERTYHYRIKTVVELDDAAMDQIERVLAKYVPVDIKAVKKTIIQKNPLDFPNVDAAEVYIVDIALQLPASGYVLAQEIKLALAIPDKFVVVRSSNDPTSLETDRLNAEKDIHDQAEKKGLLHASLLLAPKYEEFTEIPAEDLYGDVHNSRFLDLLQAAEKDRADKQKIDPPHALFKWLDMPTGDVPAEAPPRTGKGYKPPVKDRSNHGNLSDGDAVHARPYASKDSITVITGSKD